jgi:chromate reductase
VELAPPELSIGLSSLADIPLYNADVEALGDPPAVAALRAAAQASAMRIASPEFNYGVPGVLKNAIDWISRPPERSPLQRKPRERLTALMAALAAWTRRF